jgi:hypothetical protein
VENVSGIVGNSLIDSLTLQKSPLTGVSGDRVIGCAREVGALLLRFDVLLTNVCPGFVEFEAEGELIEFRRFGCLWVELVGTHTFILA